MDVRVRFAPSPTGALHIGGVRTALYNYLLARKHKGTMILRVEDTDQNRYVPGAEDYIVNSLKWVGIQIDEGLEPRIRQSERKEIYKEYVSKLVETGHAYYAYDTSEDLEEERKKDPNFQYDAKTRMRLNNSLAGKKSDGPSVIRFKTPSNVDVTVNDLIRGEVTFNTSQVDDKVLMKSDGMPTYHLANVVDDHLMRISHVIRGEEWLPSAPLHVLLYKAFGWEDTMPRFAHLPLLLKPDGNGKLSKRDADKAGFPIFPLNWQESIGYKEAGYLPEAIINFLVLLGWNPGTEQEIFSMDELIEAFSLERINKAGAKFDIQKAQWFNQQYIRKKGPEMVEFLMANRSDCDRQKAERIVEVLKDRVTFQKDFLTMGKFFFEAPTTYDDVLNKKWSPAADLFFTKLEEVLRRNPDPAAFKMNIEVAASETNVKSGSMMQILRVAITGGTAGPDLVSSMEILGAPEVADRIQKVIEYGKKGK
ncbi:MAG TPA: glutamate--tRNA ligase [Cyclobacteriaceae bacterium]|nr:glutamate--tRNA ligase [Cyclobacteriaceae bacterium]